MVTFSQIIPFLTVGAWFVALDIKEAYFHVDNHPTCRKFLHFTMGYSHYLFRVLIFGIATPPCVLTNLDIHINEEPTRDFVFIGSCLNSHTAWAFLPRDHFTRLTALIAQLHYHPQTCICHCHLILGHVTACTSVTPHTHLHMRCLQWWLQ